MTLRPIIKTSRWISFVWLGLASCPVFAKELPEIWESTRSMGMGNASCSTANDEQSLFSNPAGVGRARKARSRNSVFLTKIPNIVVGANSESRSFYSTAKAAGEASAESLISDSANLEESKPFWFRFGAFPVTMFEFDRTTPAAMGVYVNSRSKAVIDPESPEQAQLESIADMGGIFNIGMTDSTNRMNIGVQIRPTSRFAYEDTVATSRLASTTQATALAKDMRTKANRSTGIGADFGVMYTLPDYWFPSFGASILNIPSGCRENYLNPFTKKMETVCGTKYAGSFNDPNALSVIDPTDIRAGVSIMPRLARSVTIRLAAEAHHMYAPNGETTYGLAGVPPTQMANVGAEVFWGNPLKVDSAFSFRFGSSEGFYTVGFSLEALGFLLEFASYGRDVAYAGTKAVEDRRYLLGLTGMF